MTEDIRGTGWDERSGAEYELSKLPKGGQAKKQRISPHQHHTCMHTPVMTPRAQGKEKALASFRDVFHCTCLGLHAGEGQGVGRKGL